MPQGNPLGYFPPEVQAALLAMNYSPLQRDTPGMDPLHAMVQSDPMMAAVGAEAVRRGAPPLTHFAAPVARGPFASPLPFNRMDDATVVDWLRGGTLLQKANAEKEIQRRKSAGTLGIPGASPVDPRNVG